MKKTALISIFTILMLAIGAMAANAASPVQWKASYKMTSATTGVVTLSATIEPGWHVYGTKLPEDGPNPTKLFFTGAGVKFTTGVTVAPAPKKETDDMFGMTLTYWEKRVTFRRSFEITDPNNAKVTIKVNYMCCNDSNCRPPVTEEYVIEIGK